MERYLKYKITEKLKPWRFCQGFLLEAISYHRVDLSAVCVV
jgi:hypothetical protein